MSASSPREFKKATPEIQVHEHPGGENWDFPELQARLRSEAGRLINNENVALLKKYRIEVPPELLNLQKEVDECKSTRELINVFQAGQKAWESVVEKLGKENTFLTNKYELIRRAGGKLPDNEIYDKKISELAVSAREILNELKKEVNDILDKYYEPLRALQSFVDRFLKEIVPAPANEREARKEAGEITHLRAKLSEEAVKARAMRLSTSTPDELQNAIERLKTHLGDFVRVVDRKNGERNIDSEEPIKSKLFGGADGRAVAVRNQYKSSHEKALTELSKEVRLLQYVPEGDHP